MKLIRDQKISFLKQLTNLVNQNIDITPKCDIIFINQLR